MEPSTITLLRKTEGEGDPVNDAYRCTGLRCRGHVPDIGSRDYTNGEEVNSLPWRSKLEILAAMEFSKDYLGSKNKRRNCGVARSKWAGAALSELRHVIQPELPSRWRRRNSTSSRGRSFAVAKDAAGPGIGKLVFALTCQTWKQKSTKG